MPYYIVNDHPVFLHSKLDKELNDLATKDWSALDRIGARIAGSAQADKAGDLAAKLLHEKSGLKEFYSDYVFFDLIGSDARHNVWDLLYDFCRFRGLGRLVDIRSFEDKIRSDYAGEGLSFPYGRFFELHIPLAPIQEKRSWLKKHKNHLRVMRFHINTRVVQRLRGDLNDFTVQMDSQIMRFNESGIELLPPGKATRTDQGAGGTEAGSTDGGRGADTGVVPEQASVSAVSKELDNPFGRDALYEGLGKIPADFDPAKYAKAKPFFETVVNEKYKNDGPAFVKWAYERWGDPIKPYLKQFIKDLKAKPQPEWRPDDGDIVDDKDDEDGRPRIGEPLPKSQQYWMPKDSEEYLTLAYPEGRSPDGRPTSMDEFLWDQERILKHLTYWATEGEIKAANCKVEDNIPQDAQVWLPLGGFKDPQMPGELLGLQLDPDHMMSRWKADIPKMIRASAATKEEAQMEGKTLTLESFLGRLM